MTETPQSILAYWYSEPVKKMWFAATPELDSEIRNRFASLWNTAARGELEHWKQTAEGILALIIVLDQFPLNMYRQQPESFATEQLAVDIARYGIEQGLDQQLSVEQRAFFYMPLMHSEDDADQVLSVQMFEQSGLESNLRFARHHQELIRRFGRFPHRNAILGRNSSQEELDYLNSKHAFKG